MRKTVNTFIILAMFTAFAPFPALAATMNDYCVTPPFIQESILPNLLLIIDNSASMYDLAYSDKGQKVCSVSGADCTASGTCPSGQTCSFTSGREPYYCYDQTFSSAKTYAGYFDNSKLYRYDSATNELVEDSNAFSCTAGAGEEAKSLAGQLCVVYTTAAPSALVVSKFRASGQYLNWLTASKSDVQKKILTGGKYNGTDLLAESRGCVGQSFIKEANTANFVNYNSPETNNTNTALGITFGIRGPYDEVNAAAPSRGGQTYLDIFKGDYNQGNCQNAMTAIVSGTNAQIKQTVEDCLNFTSSGTQTAVTKTKVAFQQSMQACWQYRNTDPHTVGHDDINTVTNQCPDIYSGYATCSNDPKKVCTSATVATDCGAGNSCVYGPPAIAPGNSALLCGNEYEGQYYYFQGAGAAGTCPKDGAACSDLNPCSPATFKQCKKTDNVCTTDADCPGSGNSCFKVIANTCNTAAVTAGWKLIPGVTEAQMIATHNQFCSDMTAPIVIDPTDAPAANPTKDSVPAILSGVGVEAQLNQPIGTLTVKIKKTTAPTGVISDFSTQVRIGAMTFNFAGSAAEATAGTLPAPRLCSNDATKVCTLNIDCVSPGTCNATTAGTNNFDGGKIIHYIGTGHCSVTTATVCYNDANCPSGERCASDGVGSYSSGLIKAVNDIKADAWTPFAEAFYNAIGYFAKVPGTGLSRTDLRLNAGDFNENRNPSQYRCQSDNILLISDGMSTADQNSSVDDLAKLYTAAGGVTSWTTGVGACPSYAGSVNLDNMAWIAHNRNINTLSKAEASTTAPQESNESITTYVVFNGDSNGQAGECDSRTLLTQTAVNGGTSLYQAIDPAALDTALRDAFKAIAAGSASGTAASILSNSEGSGATLLQALFYPKKEFDKTNNTDTYASSAAWIGELQSYWYFLDPFLQKTSIREDTNTDFRLSLKSDKVIQFYFDPQLKKTLVNKYSDANGDGAADSSTPDAGGAGVSPDVVNSLWKAGRKLWERNLTTDPRTIYTGYNSTAGSTPQKFSNDVADSFNTDTSTEVWDILQAPAGTNAARKAKAAKLINFIHGNDQADDADGTQYRKRKVTIRDYCAAGATTFEACTKEWKLGDIVSSTPKLVSNVHINNYHLAVPTGYNDNSYAKFVASATYLNRGMAFVGANDGMLHAFKLGILKEIRGTNDKAKIVNADGTNATSGSNLGREEWAYIPRNTLPYLTYLADPNYSHLYYVDRSPLIVDASIGMPADCASGTDYSECEKKANGSTWRTIIIGGTGIGAASRDLNNTTTGIPAVKSPIAGVGYSSYFALDVTDPANPKYLWEFFGNIGTAASPQPRTGFATTGPAIVRVSAKKKNADNTYSTNPDHTKNGKWFAIFGNGPFGSIDTVTHSFKGESENNLRIFIVDLATGEQVRMIDCAALLGISDAFVGSFSSSVIDTDRNNQDSAGFYSDDAVYIGYVQKNGSVNPATWTKGGVLRLVTKESTNPADWVVSKVIDGTGPVTTSVTKLQDRKNHTLWLYFGTGRYFYKSDDTSTTRQVIYGLKEPCYSTLNRTMQTAVAGGTLDDIDKECVDEVSGTIADQSADSGAPASTLAASAPGWKILLDAKDDANGFLTERIITDPLAAANGAVFFTSFKPSGDLCKYGGNSLLWAVSYDTGSTPPARAMQGKALMQVSTGAFAEIKLSDAFKNPGSSRYDGRRLAAPITGVPPTAQGLSLFTNPPPIKKLLHMREK